MGRLLIILFTPPWQSENTNTVYEFAKAAIAEGHEVTVFCDIDATYNLMKGQLQAGQTTPAGKMTQLVAEGVHLLACRESARVRGINVKAEFIDGAVESSLGKLAELMEQYDRVVAFGWGGHNPTLVNNVLLVIKSPPYGGGRAVEGLRMATAMIAMDVLPQILFIDDGVYCLLKDQNPEAAGLASFQERLKTIADLTGLSVLSDSIRQRKLKPDDLNQNHEVKALSLDETAQLFSQSDAVITF